MRPMSFVPDYSDDELRSTPATLHHSAYSIDHAEEFTYGFA